VPFPETALIVLAGITLAAAFVNGALGYGFSSLTVPVALVFYANRVLNPALVVIEVFINLYVLYINRSSIRVVWKRVLPILSGLPQCWLDQILYLRRPSPFDSRPSRWRAKAD
jgi:uncharacterized membrane protein YfcA